MIKIDEIDDDEIPALLVGLAGRLLKKKPEPTNGHAPDRLLEADEAAERLGMKKAWLWAHSDKLPFARRIGRKIRYSERGIEEYIAKGNARRT